MNVCACACVYVCVYVCFCVCVCVRACFFVFCCPTDAAVVLHDNVLEQALLKHIYRCAAAAAVTYRLRTGQVRALCHNEHCFNTVCSKHLHRALNALNCAPHEHSKQA